MDASRARGELGWAPAHDAASTVLEALEGVAAGAAVGPPSWPGLPGRCRTSTGRCAGEPPDAAPNENRCDP